MSPRSTKTLCGACDRVLDDYFRRRRPQRHESAEIDSSEGMAKGALMWQYSPAPEAGALEHDAVGVRGMCRCGIWYELERDEYIARLLAARDRSESLVLTKSDRGTPPTTS